MVDPEKQRARGRAKKGYQNTQKDFEFHLNEQLQCLINSAKLFDQGYLCEAKKMATILRLLLHDSKSSISLFTHLGKKNSSFYDSSEGYDPENLLPTLGLLQISLASGGDFQAKLGKKESFKKISFTDWWEEPVMTVYRSDYLLPIGKDAINNENAMHKISRFNLVYDMSNKDGGAHVDTGLTEAYADLTKYHDKGSIGTIDAHGKSKKFPTPIEYCAIRQIAHEVILTINDIFPDAPNLPKVPRTEGLAFVNISITDSS
ncbi:hypothetical protein [Methanolacinia paynteri]|uniref:hypothetical protein n=1 Tax=Methanolacinia paynteri TaxID=230356 RepID=UPI00064E7CF4|nr:hypothetical protein [Methanolacinia paynteri]